jgi:hypothetical protein
MNTKILETKELLLIADKLGSKSFNDASAQVHRTVHRGKFFITNRFFRLAGTEMSIRRYTIWRFTITDHSVDFEVVGEPDQYQMHQQASEAIRHL